MTSMRHHMTPMRQPQTDLHDTVTAPSVHTLYCRSYGMLITIEQINTRAIIHQSESVNV